MNNLIDFIHEKLKVNSKSKVNTIEYKYHPKSNSEFFEIIDQRIKKEKDNIDFNDIDVSNVTSMDATFAYRGDLTRIDISAWDVSKVESMAEMFIGCKKLESIGDISDWNIRCLKDINYIFYGCKELTNIGDLNKWDSSKLKIKENAFSFVNKDIIPKWA